MAASRRYDIDWLRVITICLLLIYHIAIIFQPWAMFLSFIRSDELLVGLWKPMTMLNVWRIPLLFYISGMAMYFAMRKRNSIQLLVERSKRILLPFLFGIVAITPLHMFLFQKYYNLSFNYYSHFGHLWFLGNIFIYVILLLPLFSYMNKIGNRFLKKRISTLMSYALRPLLISVFFILEALLLKPQLFALYAQTWHGFFLGFLAFFFGFFILYSGTTFWQTVLKWRWLYFGLAVILFGVRYTIFVTEAPVYQMAVESNCWIFSLFGFGYKYLNKPSRTLSYLSKAAYPVYIIHMFVLFAGATLILPLQLPASIKFITITAFTFIGCYIIYEFIIRRINFLRPLFGLNLNYKESNKSELQLRRES
jgi:glucan biosynthesis protein C